MLRERGFSCARNLHRTPFAQTKFKRRLDKSLFWKEARSARLRGDPGGFGPATLMLYPSESGRRVASTEIDG